MRPPEGVSPVVRFRNPDGGSVEWVDLVKGPIAFANAELDDLVIARSDGTPTYNFCVVVDDWDMRITRRGADQRGRRGRGRSRPDPGIGRRTDRPGTPGTPVDHHSSRAGH